MAEQLNLTIVYEPGEDGWVIASIPRSPGVFVSSSCGARLSAARRQRAT